MECLWFNSLNFSLSAKSHLSGGQSSRKVSSCSQSTRLSMNVSAVSYQKFIDFALEETKRRTQLVPLPLQEGFNSLLAVDVKTELQMINFRAPKIRLLRCLSIENGEGMQVLDFAAFPEAEFDLPIFCANFFSTARISIVVLDLNPLHNVVDQVEYREKYYKKLMPLGLKYIELLPWGGRITSESLKFFSPIVIWSKFPSSQQKYDILLSAFKDYYVAWLDLRDQAAAETHASQVLCNQEAIHRYLTWRAEKDPGYELLKRLTGESLAKDIVKRFLFNGVSDLGSKTFLDYFPDYRCEDGSINAKRSMIGKSYEDRPWNTRGEFVG